jgi:transcriptional regulator with XRE-family HTH domain
MAPRLSDKEQQEFRKFIQRLEVYRKALNVSQAEMAKLCRIQQATYSKWASGQNFPEPLAWVGLRALEPDIISELNLLKKELQKRLHRLT